MENQNMEECVQKKDVIVFNGDAVQKDVLWRNIERIRYQGRLDHNKGVVDIFFVDDVSG
jgi:hypothetical protein